MGGEGGGTKDTVQIKKGVRLGIIPSKGQSCFSYCCCCLSWVLKFRNGLEVWRYGKALQAGL